MDSIYFEKQEGSLCAQHCLNALLQGQYFNAVDLASHADKLDGLERMRMAESGIDSVEYQKFLQQPSGNMDDSGYFSVQVISSCLKVWNLELVPYNSIDGKTTDAQKNPEKMKAYICNYKDHWFTIRRLAHQWFNLNSLLTGPILISNTYLACFLAQLQEEGYSIFVVIGEFPEATADAVLRKNPVKENETSSTQVDKKDKKQVPFQGQGHRLGTASTSGSTSTQFNRLDSVDDEDLQKALKLSLSSEACSSSGVKDDAQLKMAVELSLTGDSQPASVSSGDTSSISQPSPEDNEDPELQRALKLSLEQESITSTTSRKPNVDPHDVRNKRLAYYDRPSLNS